MPAIKAKLKQLANPALTPAHRQKSPWATFELARSLALSPKLLVRAMAVAALAGNACDLRASKREQT